MVEKKQLAREEGLNENSFQDRLIEAVITSNREWFSVSDGGWWL